MKKILLFALGMTLVSSAALADSHLSLRVAKTARTQKEHKAGVSLKTTTKSSIRPLRAVPAPERIEMRADADVQYETKLVRHEFVLDNGGILDNDVVTYTYDEYGFPKIVSGYNAATTYTYEWKVPGKVWSKRTIEFKNSGGTIIAVKSREFHQNGMISKEIDEQNGRVLEFDENGYLTKSVNADGNGATYLYFAFADRWYQGFIMPDRIEEYSIDGNGVVLTRKEKIGEEFQTIERRGEYYDMDGNQCGNMEEYYTQDGNSFVFSGCYGSRTSVTETSTERTEVNETYSTPGVWVPSYKRVHSLNYYDEWKNYSPSETRYSKSYEYRPDDASWTLESESTYSWVNAKIVKEEETYYRDNEHNVSYYLVTEPKDKYDNGLVGISYDTKTGDYAYSENDPDNDDVTYYYMCSANGTVLKKFREERYLWQEWNGTAWVKCSGTINVTEDEEDSFTVTFDSEGRVARLDEYESGEIYCYETYTYGPGNAVTIERYDPIPNGGFYKYSEAYENRDASGNLIEEWEKNYDEQGIPRYGYKNEYYSDNRVKYYHLSEIGEWEFSNWHKMTDQSVAADGTQTLINYELDENGNIISRNKNIEWNGDNGSYKREYYYWDDAVNDWVGQNKSENIMSEPLDFVCIWAANPENVEDVFIFHAPGSEQTGYQTNVTREWNWNTETKSWDLGFVEGTECSYEGNVLTIKELTPYNRETVRTITVDADRKVVRNNISQTMYEEVRTNDYTWRYNEEGMVEMRTAKRQTQLQGNLVENITETYRFFYDKVPVKGSGIEDIVTDFNNDVKAVYSLDGVKVDADAMTPGIYVVVYLDGSVRKVIVK